MTSQRFSQLWSDIDALPILFKLDLLHWDRPANASLRQKILATGQRFFPRSSRATGLPPEQAASVEP
jgi:proline iminopeptidase